MNSDEHHQQQTEQQLLENMRWLSEYGFETAPAWFPPNWQQILSNDPAYLGWLESTEADIPEDKMAIFAKSTGGDFKLLPQGAHMAVCDMVVNLGKQRTEYDGVTDFKFQVYIRFQVPAERVEISGEDKPMVTGRTYTLTLNKKSKLRELLEGWRGKAFSEAELVGFDLAALLGASCQLAIVHNQSGDRTYANIQSVMPIPKGADSPQLEGDAVLFESMTDTPDAFPLLPNFLQEKLGAWSVEVVPVAPVDVPVVAEFNDDLPF